MIKKGLSDIVTSIGIHPRHGYEDTVILYGISAGVFMVWCRDRRPRRSKKPWPRGQGFCLCYFNSLPQWGQYTAKNAILCKKAPQCGHRHQSKWRIEYVTAKDIKIKIPANVLVKKLRNKINNTRNAMTDTVKIIFFCFKAHLTYSPCDLFFLMVFIVTSLTINRATINAKRIKGVILKVVAVAT